MKWWLAMTVVLPLAAAAPAHAQMKGLAPGEISNVARTRTLDLRVSQQFGIERPEPLVRGTILRHELAPNATVGIGLSNVYAKKKAGTDWRIGERPARSRKPAVTFVLKF